MSVVIPSIEVERLKIIIIKNFCYQFKRKVSTETSFLNFIEARVHTTCGMELRTVIENKNFKIRIYVQGFDNKEVFRPFRLESVINNAPGPQDEVWVAYVVLPRVFFPALSKVKNQIPKAASSNVERPVELSLIGSTPSIYKTIEYYYLTSQLYPERSIERLESEPTFGSTVEYTYVTSQLYPVRGNEGMESAPHVADLHTPETIMPEDELTFNNDLISFSLGVVEQPLIDGYIYKTEDSAHQEKLVINNEIVSFNLEQTFFPPEIINIVYKSENQSNSDYHDDLTINNELLSFDIVQTFFPPTVINIQYKTVGQSTSDHHDDLTIDNELLSFSLTVTRP